MTDEIIDMSGVFDIISPMFWKKGRLQTYDHWPFDANVSCNPESMAAAGFHCVGGEEEPDLVECFMCSKQLDGWESNDNPWEEHRKHQPNCQYIQIGKPDESSLTVKEFFHLVKGYYKQKTKLELENSIKVSKSEWKETASTIPDIYEAMKKSQKSMED